MIKTLNNMALETLSILLQELLFFVSPILSIIMIKPSKLYKTQKFLLFFSIKPKIPAKEGSTWEA